MFKGRLKESLGDRIFDIVNHIILTLILIAVSYPVLIVISSSFSDAFSLMAGKVWLFPVNFTLDGYRAIFVHDKVWTGMYNSAVYTIAGTAINMLVTVLAAYPLSREDFTLKNPIALFFAFTMWFSGGLIPSYLLVRDLGMFNTRWAMLLPGALSIWNMIIVRTYFQNNISGEILESAKLDGCDDYRYLWQIAIPLSTPALAVVCLYYAVAHWNTFFNAYIYLQNKELFPIQVVLRDILLVGRVDTVSVEVTNGDSANAQLMNELLKYSLVVVASLPMAIIYPFIQRFFVKGIMVGAVKG